VGWWKYDTAQAEKLLKSVGFTKNGDGKWVLPDGKVWQLEFVIPGDWNKVMQRVGFSIADSWQGFGIDLKVRQVDNAEFGNVQNINAQRQTLLNWTNCIFNPNYMNSWRSVLLKHVKPADSTDTNAGNQYQWNSKTVDGLIQEAFKLETTSDKFYEIGRQVIQEFVKDMAYINIMNIPTTIPTNERYWTGFPHQENYYAVPYSWWSSLKKILVTIKPAGS
jgi:peptide/nickel transport system substrate-binding protein